MSRLQLIPTLLYSAPLGWVYETPLPGSPRLHCQALLATDFLVNSTKILARHRNTGATDVRGILLLMPTQRQFLEMAKVLHLKYSRTWQPMSNADQVWWHLTGSFRNDFLVSSATQQLVRSVGSSEGASVTFSVFSSFSLTP
jgi:hypothetical protein